MRSEMFAAAKMSKLGKSGRPTRRKNSSSAAAHGPTEQFAVKGIIGFGIRGDRHAQMRAHPNNQQSFPYRHASFPSRRQRQHCRGDDALVVKPGRFNSSDWWPFSFKTPGCFRRRPPRAAHVLGMNSTPALRISFRRSGTFCQIQSCQWLVRVAPNTTLSPLARSSTSVGSFIWAIDSPKADVLVRSHDCARRLGRGPSHLQAALADPAPRNGAVRIEDVTNVRKREISTTLISVELFALREPTWLMQICARPISQKQG